MRGRSAAPSRDRVEAEHAHRARVGRAVALEDLDGRGLARAVRSEQPEHLARRDVESRPVDGHAVAVALLEPGDGSTAGSAGSGGLLRRRASLERPVRRR